VIFYLGDGLQLLRPGESLRERFLDRSLERDLDVDRDRDDMDRDRDLMDLERFRGDRRPPWGDPDMRILMSRFGSLDRPRPPMDPRRDGDVLPRLPQLLRSP